MKDNGVRRLAAELRAQGQRPADISRVLRERFDGLSARKAIRLAVGWTQREAADQWERLFGERKAEKQFSYWENWPHSGHAPSLETLDQLARLYGCRAADLLDDLPDYGLEDEAPLAPADTRVGLTASGRNPGTSEPAPEATALEATANQAGTLLDVLRSQDDDLAQRFSAVANARAGVDRETVDGLELAALGYRQAYRSASAATLLDPVHGTLRLLVDLAPDAGRHRDRIVRMIGQMSTLVATMLMLDLNDFRRAGSYLGLSARAAQQIDETELFAFVLGCRSFHASYRDRVVDGVAFADGALAAAGKGIPPRTHGWLAAVASEMHAAARDAATCAQLLDIAAEQLDRAEATDRWLGIGIFNADKLEAYRGGDLMRLGRYTEAQEALHGALDRLDPSLQKHRTTAYVDLAEAYAAVGNNNDAALYAQSALDIIARTRHADSLRRVTELHRRLRADNTPMVQRFTDALLEVKAIV